ncbi:unnamed protein product [Staurois parvus]|uniref:Uncharacterized protein n=1 Tax=Staurois parvus TaxID=386267 RepID=A0ABN9AE97_9NEOB|nr:unnamed protein product [Staurois parvus]
MYINGRTGAGAVLKRVAFYKWPPHSLPVCAPWECEAPLSGARYVWRTQRNTDHCTGPLCEVPVM